ncbi:MAG TPA: hypothetical protein VEA38_01685, partial [Terriglobales bacterium]|nr:hypothetical protein [Terriglobales bacterium]
MTYLFKILGPNRKACHGGSGTWPEIGEWTETRDVNPCHTGWHLARPRDLIQWLRTSPRIAGATTLDFEIYIAEAEIYTEADDKVVAPRARLVRRLQWDREFVVSWAKECAASAHESAERALNAIEPVLKRLDGYAPDEKRFRVAIETARKFGRGEATRDELRAARDAAWSARWAIRDRVYDATYKRVLA